MAKNLKEAIAKNQSAADDLNRALRECLVAVKESPQMVAEVRLRLVGGQDLARMRGQSR